MSATVQVKRSLKYLEIVGLVVVHVECSEKLTVSCNGQCFHIVHTINNGLPCKLFHLDVVELSEVTEPLDQLRCYTAVELGTNTKKIEKAGHDWRMITNTDP